MVSEYLWASAKLLEVYASTWHADEPEHISSSLPALWILL